MLDLAMELHLTFDCSLRLDKQPDDQEDHHEDLAQERVAKYLLHGAIVVIERIFALTRMRCDNHCDYIREECKSCDCKEEAPGNAQFSLGFLGNICFASGVVDAISQFKSDPVLDHAHAEL